MNYLYVIFVIFGSLAICDSRDTKSTTNPPLTENKQNITKTDSKPKIVDPNTTPQGAKHSPKKLALISLSKCNKRCHCKDIIHCNPNLKLEKRNKERATSVPVTRIPAVVMMSNGSEMWHHWQWRHITAVMSDGYYSEMHSENWDLLCYAHSLGKRYGYVEKIKNTGQFVSYDVLTAYILKDMNRLYCSYDSLFALEFNDLFKDPGDDFTIEKFAYFLTTIKLTLLSALPREKLYCVVPWKPCVNTAVLDCDRLSQALLGECDFFVLSPDSFKVEDTDCKATPGVSMVKLILGVDQYVSRGVKPEQIIVGVPWHGYDHTCTTFNNKTGVCKYNQNPGKAGDEKHFCGEEKVKYESLGHLAYQKKIGVGPNVLWSSIHEAPFFIYKDKQDKTHQVWFENWRSLSKKYKLVREFEFGGVSIWYGDDLMYDSTNAYLKGYDLSMWNYLAAGLFYPYHPISECPDYAGKVAGAAIGCLLLGGFLGFIFMYLGCVRTRRFTLRPPFRKDAEQFIDEPDM